jgi:hypothetical protein
MSTTGLTNPTAYLCTRLPARPDSPHPRGRPGVWGAAPAGEPELPTPALAAGAVGNAARSAARTAHTWLNGARCGEQRPPASPNSPRLCRVWGAAPAGAPELPTPALAAGAVGNAARSGISHTRERPARAPEFPTPARAARGVGGSARRRARTPHGCAGWGETPAGAPELTAHTRARSRGCGECGPFGSPNSPHLAERREVWGAAPARAPELPTPARASGTRGEFGPPGNPNSPHPPRFESQLGNSSAPHRESRGTIAPSCGAESGGCRNLGELCLSSSTVRAGRRGTNPGGVP